MERSQCTICQEPLVHDNTAACPCGHTFHYHCILAWYERSKSCPQCRKHFKSTPPIKLYFDVPDNNSEVDWGTLKNQLSDCNAKLLEHAALVRKKDSELLVLQSQLEETNNAYVDAQKALNQSKSNCMALKRQLGLLEKIKDNVQRYKDEASHLRKELYNLNSIETLVNGERHEVEDMLKNYSDHSESLHQLATSFTIMKKEFDRLKESKQNLVNQKKETRKQLEDVKQQLAISQIDKKKAEQHLHLAETDLQSMERECQSLRDKLTFLEKKLSSSSPATISLKRVLAESPVPIQVKTPRLSSEVDFQQSHTTDYSNQDRHDLSFSSSFKQQFGNEFSEEMDEFGLQKVNICDGTQLPQKCTTRVLKKKSRTMISSTSNEMGVSTVTPLVSISNTYNGLGGRSRLLSIPKRNVSSKVKVPKKRQSQKASFLHNPPLPSLDSFFD